MVNRRRPWKSASFCQGYLLSSNVKVMEIQVSGQIRGTAALSTHKFAAKVADSRI